MSVSNPAYIIHRQSVVGMEGEWCKMFDPPTASPDTPELLAPTNPVPAFIAANVPGAGMSIPNTVRRTLLHGLDITMWDGKKIKFYAFGDPDIPQASGGVWPAPTIRVPRGVIFHGETKAQGPPPHTIHWHGIEPTPINDGVGHCSMELGQYTYQWQPNFIGTYFYHCHRNTMQHFEFGLYGMLLIEPPDAFDPSDGKNVGGYPRRTAANLANFPQFPGFVGGDLAGGDPHAMTVPYDIEALWVLDDRSSQWSDNMPGAKDTFPEHGKNPGVDDKFFKGDFHDFNADYFFVTGVPFPGPVGSTVACAPNVVVPHELNSGVAGMQVSISAHVDETILVRCLCAAYVSIKVTFPVDVVIIAFDGRALGVPPFAQYNHPFLLKAGTPYELSTARRFDALIRETKPIDSFANVEFIEVRGGRSLLNGRIPIKIAAAGTSSISGNITSGGAPLAGVTVSLTGDSSATTTTDAAGNYSFSGLHNAAYMIMPSLAGYSFTPAEIETTINGANVTGLNFVGTPVTGAFSLSGHAMTPQGQHIAGITMTLSGDAVGAVLTDAAGNFSFQGLGNGNYTVTPGLAGYTFEPASISATVNGGNVAGLEFMAIAASSTFSISGNVTSGGNPLAGVAMTLGGDGSGSVLTDSAGNYSFAGLANGNYTVTPGMPGLTFTPLSRNVIIGGANVTGQDFVGSSATGNLSISGTVTFGRGGLAGVLVTLSGSVNATALTNSAGAYTFPNLPNGNYTITPGKSGYAFTPSSKTVTLSGSSVTGQNFAASLSSGTTTYSISGVVTSGRSGVQGVLMTLSGAASVLATTNSAGAYTFQGLANGTYTVTPSQPGATFTPTSITVTINGANATGKNFKKN
jgi:hypothetical protein